MTTLKRHQKQPATPNCHGQSSYDDIFDKSLTDAGLAERFVYQHQDNVRYCYDWKSWIVYDGVRWTIDRSNEVMRLALATVKSLRTEFEAASSLEKRDRIEKFARKSKSHSSLLNMTRVATALRPLPIGVEELDQDPYLLNCPNGTVNLHTGELLPHNPAHFITHCCRAECADSSDAAHRWRRFLEEIFDQDQNLIRFIQQLLGVALIGKQVEHYFPVFSGNGANGKSVFTNTVLGVLGDYAMQAPRGFLLERRGEPHPTEQADLYGKRFVIVSESKDGQQLDDGLVKSLTGGDRIRARRMREDFWEFSPSHMIGLVTNNKPRITACDNGMWRRVLSIPFDVTFSPERQEKHLARTLENEMPGILRWMVDGCVEWVQERRVGIPKRVKEATDAYQRESDVVQDFIDDCCECRPEGKVAAQVLYDAYAGWAERNGRGQLSSRRLSGLLKQKDFAKKKISVMHYLGIALRDEALPK